MILALKWQYSNHIQNFTEDKISPTHKVNKAFSRKNIFVLINFSYLTLFDVNFNGVTSLRRIKAY